MRELAILTFITLDGVMQGPSSSGGDPSGQFTRSGWAADYWEDVMTQVRQEAMAKPYDILFGRKTYELFAAHWPNTGDDNPVGKMMNNATKYVASSTLTTLEWENSTLLTGDIVSEVSRLKEQDGPLLQIHGSWQLIQSLLAHGLIDEFRLWTFPVVVGSGRRLFGQDTPPTSLKLVRTAPCPNGAVMSIYRLNR